MAPERVDGGLTVEVGGADDVVRAVAALGRSEDVCFSPAGTRLAIAAFAADAVAVVGVAIDASAVDDGRDGPSVALRSLLRVHAPGLAQPHGVAWLDDATLLVGNRDGGLVVLALPPEVEGVHQVAVLPEATVPPGDLLKGPGSVVVLGARGAAGGDRHEVEVLVCNNWGRSVASHRLTARPRWDHAGAEVWAARNIDLPDGIAVSDDGRWVAVSAHDRQLVYVYDRSPGAVPPTAAERAPTAVLRGSSYPHGLRFAPDATALIVADAGSTDLHVYRRPGEEWVGVVHPTARIPVVDPVAFAAAHVRPDEGGPKGLAIDPSGTVLAVAAETQPLAFLRLDAALGHVEPLDPAALVAHEVAILDRTSALQRELDAARLAVLETQTREHDAQVLLRDERARVAEAEQRAAESEARAAEAVEAVAAVEATRLFRMAEPARRLYARHRHRRPRPG